MSRESAKTILRHAIEAQKKKLKAYEKPCEVLTFETLRALDDLHCRGLFPEGKDGEEKSIEECDVMSWGINDALRRIIPDQFEHGPFKLFQSTRDRQVQADNFIFDCGVLGKAERLRGWLHEGLFDATVRETRPEHVAIARFIVALTAKTSSAYSEAIGHRGQMWANERAMREDRNAEMKLERRHVEILPDLTRRVQVAHNWGMSYTTSSEFDLYFLNWAQLYLRRIPYSDMIAPEEVIGGRKFEDYISVLTVLSGRSQMHLCFAGLLKHKHPWLSLRNLLTSWLPLDEVVQIIAARLDAETLEIQRLLSHLTLEPSNKGLHTEVPEPTWPPVVRVSDNNCILPLYGLEINPFPFLLRDLRQKYSADWFRLANNREQRWLREIEPLFYKPRWITSDRSVPLRDGGVDRTDIDFAAYDSDTGEVGLFQLKWQQPVDADDGIRRSAGKNLTDTSNRWVKAVLDWLDKYGVHELGSRLGLRSQRISSIRLFVVGRYHAYFSGYDDYNDDAVWTDWHHLLKVRLSKPNASVSEFADSVMAEIAAAREANRGESLALPLGDVAIIVNPARVNDR
jgi:hypothetical protein